MPPNMRAPMNERTRPIRRRHGTTSIVMIVVSIGVTVAVSLAMDIVLLRGVPTAPALTVITAILFNVTVIVLSSVGSIIEWQRPGHAVGRLLMLSGPLYATVSAAWLTGDALESILDPGVYATF